MSHSFPTRRASDRNVALDRIVFAIEYLRAIASDDDPVAFLQIGDLLRQRRKSQGIAAEIGFAPIFVSWAITDDERRAEARADEQVGVAAKGEDRQGVGWGRSVAGRVDPGGGR